MARAHFVKKAMKDNPVAKKGESYYWWAFMVGGRGGPKHYSKTAPKPSQLTQSEFLSQVYGVDERLQALSGTAEEVQSEIDDIKSELESLADEQEEKLSNMPDGLQQSETGELLQSRADSVREMVSELEAIDVEGLEGDELDQAVSEAQAISYQGE